MGESAKHLELVRCILIYVQENYVGVDHVAMLHDLPGSIGCDKPPKIGEFRPDVYAVDAPLTKTIIGEAKTQADLETDHTKNQLRAFMRFLRLQDNAVLVLAVPWQAKARGRTILKALAGEIDAPKTRIVVIDETQ